jgi:hypothetical protein
LPRVLRSFNTDLDELYYQLTRSDYILSLKQQFQDQTLDEQEVQECLDEFVLTGRCRLEGDRGLEEWAWTLTEREAAIIASRLYLQDLGGS